MDGQLAWPRDPCDGRVDFVHERHDVAGIARIPCRHAVRKDKARGWVRCDTGLPAKLGGTIALAFDDGRNGEIVGIDQFTVPQFLALSEPSGLLADVRMTVQGRLERLGDSLALSVTERCSLG